MKLGKLKIPSDKARIEALEGQVAQLLEAVNTLVQRQHGAAAALCGAQVILPQAAEAPSTDMNFKVQHD